MRQSVLGLIMDVATVLDVKTIVVAMVRHVRFDSMCQDSI